MVLEGATIMLKSQTKWYRGSLGRDKDINGFHDRKQFGQEIITCLLSKTPIL